MKLTAYIKPTATLGLRRNRTSTFAVAVLLGVGVAGPQAQLTLTGISYIQNFDSIGTGLPTGWTGNTGATASALGTATTLTTAATDWNNTGGSFKNVAANDSGLLSTANTATQAAATDRAFGIRQTGAFGDPGAAFTLQIGNTTGFGTFTLSVNLEMLSVQTRSTTWTVQYGLGSAPTSFTTLGTYADPGAFGSTPFTLSGAALLGIANQSQNVWIRIVALTASTGSGNRDTFAIDDFSLTYAPIVATSFIFDINGAVAGSGNPTGTYNFSSANWSSSAAGDVATSTFVADQIATFATGADGTGTYTVVVDTPVSVGGLAFEEGDVTIASGSGTLTLTGASISVANGASASISEPILGSVGLNKSGSGTLTLTGTNLYTGVTTVGGGIVSIATDGNLGDVTTDITLGGGTLQSTTTISLDAGRDLSGTGSLAPASGTTLTFSGAVNTGAVTVSDSGTVALAAAAGTKALTGLTFSNAGTVSVTGADLSLPGNITTTHTSGTATVSGNINFGSGTRTITVADGSAATDLLLSGNLSGAAVLAKLGTGTLSLTGNNSGLTGTGSTLASIRQGAAAAVPTGGGTISFNNVNALGVGQLQLNGGTLNNASGSALVITNANGISTGAQDHANTPGGLVFAGSAMEFTGGVALFKATSASYQHMITVNNNTTFSGTFGPSTGSGTSTGLTVGGTGILILSGNNTFTEAVTAAGSATIRAGSATALGTGGLTVGSGTTLDLHSDLGVSSLNGTGTVTNTLIGMPKTLTVGKIDAVSYAANSSFGGVIQNGTSALAVTKEGSGTLTLTGSNTFTGATTVNAGTLEAGAAGALGTTSAIAVNNGGTLLLSGAGNLGRIADGAGVTLDGGTILKGSGASEGTGNSTANGDDVSTIGLGALTLSNNSTLDFGTGAVGTLTFTAFAASIFTLNVLNYTTTASGYDLATSGLDGTDDRLIFNYDVSAGGFLDQISFNGGGASQINLGDGFYEIVPVPEPTTILGGLALLGLVGYRERRRFFAKTNAGFAGAGSV